MRKNVLFRDICLILLLNTVFFIGRSNQKVLISIHSENKIMVRKDSLFSTNLERKVHFEIYKIENNSDFQKGYKLLIFNDGQDLIRMKMDGILTKNSNIFKGQNLLIVGIRPLDRLHEYGTMNKADYMGRGSLARKYAAFVTDEFLPSLRKDYLIQEGVAIAGFSLGGLSAFDIALHHPGIFDKVGVFSGSFWWRGEEFNAMNPDGHRIVIDYLKNYKLSNKTQEFWFQTGELDEESDRNNNGIIDSIDDTMDVISILKLSGVSKASIQYTEVKGGTHSVETWAGIMPEFLRWWVGN